MSDRQRKLIDELQRVDALAPGAGLPKHRKMAGSPFLFLRGSAQLFYADLADATLQLPEALYQLPLTCVMGDCHVSNFGFLTEEGSHGDRVIFAPNDFDDACYGHAAWDLARFGLSLLLCAEHCRGLVAGRYRGEEDVAGKPAVSADQAERALRAFLNAYTETCGAESDEREHHDAVLDRFGKKHILAKRYKKALQRAYGGADFMHKSSLAKAVDLTSHPLRFRDLPERFVRVEEGEYRELLHLLEPYMDDSVLDLVERLGAGTGSHNMRRFYLLVGPEDIHDDTDLPLCHVVEVKQQRQAAPLHHFPGLAPGNRLDPAHLTVVCQRRMQRDPDLLLDEAEWAGAHWLIRSRHHARVGIDPEDIAIGKRAVHKGGFEQYAAVCGRALALTHARSDRRSTRFERRAQEILPQTREPLIEALRGYAALVERDRGILAELIDS